MEEKIEKELITQLEKQKRQNTTTINVTEVPPSYINETISNEANIDTYLIHFTKDEADIKSKQKLKMKKIKLYNHKIGTFTYKTSDRKSVV